MTRKMFRVAAFAASCMIAAAADNAAYFEVTATGGSFVIRLTDPARIQEARNIVAGTQTDRVSVSGIIVKAPAAYNPEWNFHLDPNSIEFFSMAIEVCDGALTYVDEHREEVGGALLPNNRWCPWSSRVQSEITDPSGTERLLTVTSAASFSEVAISPESLASAIAEEMTDRTESASGTDLPMTLAGLTVEIQPAEGEVRQAPLLFASPEQINFLVPGSIEPGEATVRVIHEGGGEFEAQTRIERTAPGIFFASVDDKQYANAILLRVRADGSTSVENVVEADPETGDVTAVPIDFGPEGDRLYLSLYGTAFRDATQEEISVNIVGADSVPVLFAGPQDEVQGLDQLNIELPRSLATEEDAEIRITTPTGLGTLNANSVWIAIKRAE